MQACSISKPEETERMQCDPEGSTLEKDCAICKEQASGTFFGATVCLPCKSFFIRCTRDGDPDFACQFSSACDVTYGNRSSCQACRYQKCLAAGMRRKERPEQVEPVAGQELCSVCSDISNGIHFGVPTCEGCKKFFRRGLKESSTYICRGNKLCQINPRNRNSCRYCRFKKCLLVGMSREAVRMGRPRKDGSAFGVRNPNVASIGNKYSISDDAFRPAMTEPRSSANYQFIQPLQNADHVEHDDTECDINLSSNISSNKETVQRTVSLYESQSTPEKKHSIGPHAKSKKVLVMAEGNSKQMISKNDAHCNSCHKLCMCKICTCVSPSNWENTHDLLNKVHCCGACEPKNIATTLHRQPLSQEIEEVNHQTFVTKTEEIQENSNRSLSSIQDSCTKIIPLMDEQQLLKINTTFLSYVELVKSDRMWREYSQVQKVIYDNQTCSAMIDVNDVLFTVIQYFPDVVDYWSKPVLLIEGDLLNNTDKKDIAQLTSAVNIMVQKIHQPDRNNKTMIDIFQNPWYERSTESRVCRIPDTIWPFALKQLLDMIEGGIEFAMHIPGYSNICEKDQHLLVHQGTVMATILVGSCLLYDEQQQDYLVSWRWPMHPTVPFHYVQSECRPIMDAMRALDLSKEEVALLAACFFTVKVNADFVDAEAVRKVLQHLTRLLCLYINENGGEGPERVAEMMKMAPRLTLLSEWLMKVETCFCLPFQQSAVNSITELVVTGLNLTDQQPNNLESTAQYVGVHVDTTFS